MNPDDEEAEQRFLKIQEAYKNIQLEKDPSYQERFKKEFKSYQKSKEDSDFKSRRPSSGKAGDEKEEFGNKEYFSQATKMHQDATDWGTEKFLRRYRYQHLRNKSSVPMSIKNEDRHGLGNL